MVHIMMFWTLVKPIPKCWLSFWVLSSERSHKMIARLASFVLLPSVFLLFLGGMETVTSGVSQWRGLVSPALTSAQKAVQLELDKTTLFFLSSLMLSKNLHWACSIFEMFFFCISHWPVCFFPGSLADRQGEWGRRVWYSCCWEFVIKALGTD